jgi:hypothetical protein
MNAGFAASKYVRIKNRWTGEYLHTENKKSYVERGNVMPGWHSAQWEMIRDNGGYIFKNRYTGQFLYGSSRNVGLSHRLYSLKKLRGALIWKLERAEKGFYRLKNLRRNIYMHIENKREYVETGHVMPAWHSAQWVIERVL